MFSNFRTINAFDCSSLRRSFLSSNTARPVRCFLLFFCVIRGEWNQQHSYPRLRVVLFECVFFCRTNQSLSRVSAAITIRRWPSTTHLCRERESDCVCETDTQQNAHLATKPAHRPPNGNCWHVNCDFLLKLRITSVALLVLRRCTTSPRRF